MKLNDCKYDKVKLLYTFSKMLHYIEKHAEENAKKANDAECLKLLAEIKKNLEHHIAQLDSLVK